MAKAKNQRPSEVNPLDGEPLRFHVRSRSRPIQHLVDLAESRCGCERSMIHQERCWHIKQAVEYVKTKMGWSAHDWAHVEQVLRQKAGQGAVGTGEVQRPNDADCQDGPF